LIGISIAYQSNASLEKMTLAIPCQQGWRGWSNMDPYAVWKFVTPVQIGSSFEKSRTDDGGCKGQVAFLAVPERLT